MVTVAVGGTQRKHHHRVLVGGGGGGGGTYWVADRGHCDVLVVVVVVVSGAGASASWGTYQVTDVEGLSASRWWLPSSTLIIIGAVI